MATRKSTDKDGIKTVHRVLNLSDAEFEKWLDKVERAGLSTSQ